MGWLTYSSLNIIIIMCMYIIIYNGIYGYYIYTVTMPQFTVYTCVYKEPVSLQIQKTHT